MINSNRSLSSVPCIYVTGIFLFTMFLPAQTQANDNPFGAIQFKDLPRQTRQQVAELDSKLKEIKGKIQLAGEIVGDYKALVIAANISFASTSDVLADCDSILIRRQNLKAGDPVIPDYDEAIASCETITFDLVKKKDENARKLKEVGSGVAAAERFSQEQAFFIMTYEKQRRALIDSGEFEIRLKEYKNKQKKKF